MNRIVKKFDKRQGSDKKVLCVCHGNQLRSPTAALVLSLPPYNYNTRSCGVDPQSAVCLIDAVMVAWADEIVVMEEFHKGMILEKFGPVAKPIKVLGLADDYTYRQPALVEAIKQKYAGQK